MNVRRINDSVFESLFRQAVIDNFYEELDSLPPDDELSGLYTFSPGHEARMKKLFTREARRERIRAAANWVRGAAAIFVIAAAILFGALMFVPEVRATVTETILEWYGQFVRFTSDAPDTEKTNLEPAYIPEGFWEDDRAETEITTIIIYANDDGLIIVFQSGRSSDVLSVDNEGRRYEIITLDGNEYHVLAAIDINGDNTIVWESAGQRYAVMSTVSVDELFKMAISVGE